MAFTATGLRRLREHHGIKRTSYHVSYAHSQGFGAITITVTGPLTAARILDVEKYITKEPDNKQRGIGNVVILAMTKLDEVWQPEENRT